MEITMTIILGVTATVVGEAAFDIRELAPNPPFKVLRYRDILAVRIKQEEQHGRHIKHGKHRAKAMRKPYVKADEPRARMNPREHRVPVMAPHPVEFDMGRGHKAILPFESNDRGDMLPFISPSDEVIPFVEPCTGLVPIRVKNVKNETDDTRITKKANECSTKIKGITTGKTGCTQVTKKKKTKGTPATVATTANPEESYYVPEYGTLTLPGYPTPNFFRPWKLKEVRKMYGLIAKPFVRMARG